MKIDESTLSSKQTNCLWITLESCESLERLSLLSSTLPAGDALPVLPTVDVVEASLLPAGVRHSAILASLPNATQVQVRIGGQEDIDRMLEDVSDGMQKTKGRQRVFDVGFLLFIGKSDPILQETITRFIDGALSHTRHLEQLLLEALHLSQSDLIRIVNVCRKIPTIRIIG